MAARSYLDKLLLKRDAYNRFWRAVYVAIGVNLITDVWPLVIDAVGSGSYDWHNIELAALRVIGQGAGAYLLRRFGDGSALPTPIPPADPGTPATEEPPVLKAAALVPDVEAPKTPKKKRTPRKKKPKKLYGQTD